MARFKIISKDGNAVRYEGKPRYIGTYLKPSHLEFSEIASPTPIAWEVGDYVDYPRTGMRYYLYSIPQASKNARKGTHGRAFTYSNVQLFAATKELEIAPFRDLVPNDNGIHFSTAPDVATFENVYGIARRIQACMDDLYPGRWEIRVAEFFADDEVAEEITTAKDFALSGGTCLDALSKIYELWQDIGWIHTHEDGVEVITIGYANKRIAENTTDPYLYGKGNGLTAIRKNQTNKDEFATRLYVYGSDRNLPSRYYNGLNILNAESVDIRNLMLPLDTWGTTNGLPDARKAYIENTEAVAKYGVIPKTHYFDSTDAGADIYPSIEGMTIGQIRTVLAELGDTAYSPDATIYPTNSERVDEVKAIVTTPDDNGVINKDGNTYAISKTVELTSGTITKVVPAVEASVDIVSDFILYEENIQADFHHGEISIQPSMKCYIPDVGFKSVIARVTLADALDPSTAPSAKTTTIVAEKDEDNSRWIVTLKDMSVKYDKVVYDGGFPILYYITLSVEKDTASEAKEIQITFEEGTAFLGIKEILEKNFTLRLKQIGFNINNKAALGSGKTISMKSGMCQGRDFAISSCVYVPWLDSWDITLKRQQDDTLGMLFPNTSYPISEGDRFILLDIAMPELYIRTNMERLLSEGEKLLARASKVLSHYEPSIDAKVMIESGRTLREGMFMEISDEDVIDNATDHILIDTLSIYEDESAIPTYKVTLRERRKVTYKGTPSATSASNTKSVGEGEVTNADIDLSNYVTKDQLAALDTLKGFFYPTEDGLSIGTKYNFFSEQEVSANGLNLGDGSSVTPTITLHGISDLGKALADGDTSTFSANAINSIYNRLVEFEENGGSVDLANYYTKTETDAAITSALSQIGSKYLSTEGGKISGDLRLKGDTNYGNFIYFGDGSYCYLNEDVDDHLKIYADKGINLATNSGSVTVNGSPILTSHQSIYGLTLKNSAGTTVLSYVPNSNSAILTLTKAMVGLSNVSNLASSEYFTSLSSGTTNAVSMTIGGVTKNIAASTMKSSLGLKAMAYQDSVTWDDVSDVTYGSISLNGSSSTYATVSGSASSKSFYAPTSAGTSGYWLKSNGSGEAPTWASIADLRDSLDIGEMNYLSLSGGTITGNLRLQGSTNYGNYIYFGNSSYCYLNEDSDNHLTIYASKGITLSVGSSYEVFVSGALEASTFNGYTLGEACSRSVTTSITSGSSSLITSGAIYSWAGSSNIKTVGTITSGKWNGTAIAVAYGGTGATTAADARSNLGCGAAATYSVTTSVTSGSASLVTSGGVHSALSGYLKSSGGSISGNLSISGTLKVTGTSTFTSQTTHNGGISTTTFVASGAVTPAVNEENFLGTSTKRWKYFYSVSGNFSSNLTIGGLTAANGGVTIPTGKNLKIGSATVTWDSGNAALMVDKTFYSSGEISANGLYTSSDMRFKNRIADVLLDIDTIANAPMFRFTWRDGDKKEHIGTSAQYWKGTNARELVTIDNNDFHRLDYATLGVLMGVSLAKRVKELERRMMYGN